jgi:endonuclease/exonuclease/phosphatase (EEP) superfamily protein YafD
LAPRITLKLSVKLAAGAAIALATLSGIGVYLGAYSSMMDLVGQLALQAGIGAAVLAVILLAMRAWRIAAASAIASVLAFSAIAPKSDVPPCTAPAPHRIVFLNVWRDNPDIANVVHFLATTHADAIVLAEFRPQFRKAFAKLAKSYPYQDAFRTMCPRIEFCDVVALSRVPIVIHTTDSDRFPFPIPNAVSMTLDFADGPLNLTGIHLPHLWPLGPRGFQHFVVSRVAHTLKETTGPTMVVGDFNTATWSAAVARISHAGHLSALSSKGTWRTNMPWPLRIPIDQALVGKGVMCATKSVSGRLSSDHRAIIIDFALKPKSKPRAGQS